ncbi:hypothetical protein EVAR_51871_1 [Eumeta japonica]|uniref:Uncharacterized protein n=1 Tax=Eumeta variegata TaxID=151549 RepID=A0A4C1YNP0_EUMVA|nr:hypothetical protein EVAR_51871_1 [Eumeta japonica]
MAYYKPKAYILEDPTENSQSHKFQVYRRGRNTSTQTARPTRARDAGPPNGVLCFDLKKVPKPSVSSFDFLYAFRDPQPRILYGAPVISKTREACKQLSPSTFMLHNKKSDSNPRCFSVFTRGLSRLKERHRADGGGNRKWATATLNHLANRNAKVATSRPYSVKVWYLTGESDQFLCCSLVGRCTPRNTLRLYYVKLSAYTAEAYDKPGNADFSMYCNGSKTSYFPCGIVQPLSVRLTTLAPLVVQMCYENVHVQRVIIFYGDTPCASALLACGGAC